MAYDRIDPFGDQRADLRAGIIAATVANNSMSPPKEPRTPSDYMIFAGNKRRAEPILLKDKKKQSALIRRALFGIKG